jgi:Tol biopolymer transport system component
VAFFSSREAGRGIYVKPADGSDAARLIAPLDERAFPIHWSRDGQFVSYVVDEGADADIWIARPDGSTPPASFQSTAFDEWDGAFSPDGRWLAFTSDETGREEVYVTPFPGPGGKWQISTDEGDRPRWSADGSHLYYLDNDDHLNVAEVDGAGAALVVGRVRQLFELSPQRPGAIYDLFPDDRRLLVNHRLGTNLLTRLVLVQNWHEELR